MVESGSLKRGWWEPVRKAVTRFAGAEVLVPSVQSEKQIVLGTGKEKDQDLPMPEKVVITYISRQASRRRLIEDQHQVLVAALQDLAQRRGWELNVIQAEKLTKDEQVRAVAKATVRCLPRVRALIIVLTVLIPDPPRRTRQRSNPPRPNGPNTRIHRHRDVLPRRLRPRLRMDHKGSGDETLCRLE